ncbi:hypothetical protein K474DRAFT_1773115 [Panus rudis PR-1116 ss-1]|nr:hypothetical protein K474DRAFT_1773115 [Panus rudis PR-1116 ss-1]
MSRIPVELTFAITSYLRHDRQTLASLALVSREWLVVARYYLFHDVHAESQRRAPDGREMEYRRLFSLCQLGRDARSNVRRLQLSPGCDPEAVVFSKFLSYVLDHLPCVSTLVFEDVRLQGFELNEPRVPMASIKTLSLRNVAFTLTQLDQMVAMFPKLEVIQLLDVALYRAPGPEYAIISNARSPTLRAAVTELPNLMHARVTTAACVNTLLLDIYVLSDLRSANVSLASVGSRLTTLHVKLKNLRCPENDERQKFLDLSPCTNVRTLHLILAFTPGCDSSTLCIWNAAINLLQQTRESADKIFFSIPCHQSRISSLMEYMASCTPWAHLDAALTACLPRSSITFRYTERGLYDQVLGPIDDPYELIVEDWTQFIAEGLPATHATGRLRCS